MSDSDQSVAELDRRAFSGIRALFGRQVVNLVVGLAGGVALARLLGPAEFGTYAIVTFLVNAFNLLGDLGLGAGLIQRRDPPTEETYDIAFSLQMAIAGIVVGLIWLASFFVSVMYPHAPQETAWLIRIFALTLFVTPFRAVSSVHLERKLSYGPIARADMAQLAVYQALAVGLAAAGCSTVALVTAGIVQTIVGAALVFRAAPWRPRLRLSWQEMRRMLSYGVAFQASGVLNVIGSWVGPTMVGGMLGPRPLGYLGFAGTNARRPLLVVDAVMRVSFPHFSALNDRKDLLRRRVGDYLVIFTWVIAAWIAFLPGPGLELIRLIYSAKWAPAYPLLLILALCLPFDVISWTMGFSYAAVNRNWVEVRLVGARSILSVVLGVALVPFVGVVGVPVAYLIASLATMPIMLWQFSPGFLQEFCRNVWWVAVAAVAAGTTGWMLYGATIHVGGGLARMIISGVGEAVAFIAISAWTAPRRYKQLAARRVLSRMSGKPGLRRRLHTALEFAVGL